MFGTLLRTELLIWIRTKENWFWAITWPILWIILVWTVFPPLPGRTKLDTLRYFYPSGIVLILVSATLVSFAIKLAMAKEQKELVRWKLLPVSMWSFFAAELLASAVFAVMAIFVFTVVTFALGGPPHGGLIGAVVLVVLGMITFSSLAFLIAGVTRSVSQANVLSMLLMFLVVFLSNTFFDLSGAPAAMRIIASILPANPICEGLRGVLVYGQPLIAHLSHVAILAGWAVAGTALAVATFKVQ